MKNQMPGFLEGTNPLGEINEAESRLEKLKASFLNISDKEELFFKIIEFFPYPIQVYSPEGTSIMVNSALLDEFEISSRYGDRQVQYT